VLAPGLAGALEQQRVTVAEHAEQCRHLAEIDAAETLVVVDQVGELDALRLGRRAGQVGAVDCLAHRSVAVARLADVGQFTDQPRDVIAELVTDVLEGRLGILDGVVQPCRGDHCRVVDDFSEQL
jgi:hypothetical protein